jgi:acetyltransferase
MNTHYLSSLFTPKSVVLFGASDKQDSVGGVVFRNLLTSGFKGRIFAINPKRDEVQGQKSIPGIVEECGEHGVKMMLILSAGFRETGAEGRRLEDQVTQLVRRHGIRLMGPNCLGIIRPDRGLNITFGNNNAQPGSLAFVSQSGAICTAILDWAEKNDIGFSAVVSNWFLGRCFHGHRR